MAPLRWYAGFVWALTTCSRPRRGPLRLSRALSSSCAAVSPLQGWPRSCSNYTSPRQTIEGFDFPFLSLTASACCACEHGFAEYACFWGESLACSICLGFLLVLRLSDGCSSRVGLAFISDALFYAVIHIFQCVLPVCVPC